ncbi:ecdysone-induced protein 74EF-like isoform X2 [Episyrphus balteatus]|uniref:ecdysone-induced protein 74EF-like isoform X2 n=1 Tax=Episyrphus balteatus TaxID=286459 RepID=UPI0024854E11|nr:ecdysone-induced protein 74EF-like isoform X2 [Episyrphus balteatus]
MPFIDDALLWCPDNDGRMVGGLDIATCLQDASTGNGNSNQNTDLNDGSCELNSLDPLCNDSSEELFRQLSESNFEIESLLSDLATVEVKQEENNNNLTVQQQQQQQQQGISNNGSTNFMPGDNSMQSNVSFMQQQSVALVNSIAVTAAETALLALAASVTACSSSSSSNISPQHQQHQNQRNFNGPGSNNSNRFSIAANPLLAEKLLSPNTNSLNDLDSLTIGSRNGRPPELKDE